MIGPRTDALPDDVTVLYQGNLISNLSSCKLTIWNSGREAIRNSDVVALDPIGIKASNNQKILRVAILKLSKPTNGVVIKEYNENELKAGFDYLDPKQGFQIEVLFTGPGELGKLQGTIIDMPHGPIEGNPANHILLFGIPFAILLPLPYFFLTLSYRDMLFFRLPEKLTTLGFLIGLISFGAMLSNIMGRRFERLRVGIPKGLR